MNNQLPQRQLGHKFRSRLYLHAGLSLIELLIALGIGLFMLIGIVTLVVSVSQSRVELDKTSEQIENGRYALQVLSEDLHNTGFYGVPQPEVDVYSTPDPCATTAAITNLEFAEAAGTVTVPAPVYGYAAVTSTTPSCLSNQITGSEALVVRQVSSSPTTAASVGAAGTAAYVQVSANAKLDTTVSMIMGTTTAAFTLHAKDGTIASVRRYFSRIYFLSGCDDCTGSGDGIPTLKVAELVGNSIDVKPLVEGIEDVHFEYGLDLVGSDGTSATIDGAADCYVDDPGAAPAACTGIGTWPTNATDRWKAVTTVRIHLLARSVQTTPSWTDTRTYDMGRATRTPAANDHYRRQVYTVVATLNNPRGVRE